VPIETFNYLDSLNAANPPTSDGLVGGDDHIRGIKATLKATFPNITGAVSATQGQLNSLLGWLTGGISSTFTMSLTGSSAGIELGASGVANNPFIDFHSSANFGDFDARIQAIGGNATAGQGQLNVTCNNVQFSLNIGVSGQGNFGSIATGSLASTGVVSGSSVTASGAVSGATVSASGNVSGATVSATGAVSGASVTASGNVSGANVSASGNVSGNTVSAATVTATGNVSGANLSASGTVSATGNVSGANVSASGTVSGNTVSATGNVTGANVSASGTVSGANVSASGTVSANTVSATGNVSGQNVTAAGNVSGNTVTGNTVVGALPAGTIMDFAGTSAPSGWLACDGGSLSTTTFAQLFARIGYTWGGSGSSFNVPNFISRYRRHRDNGSLAGFVGNLQGPANLTHTHGVVGNTGGQSVDHSHGVDITSGAMSANASHSHTTSEFLVSVQNGSGANQGNLVNTNGGATINMATNSVNLDHTHRVLGNTAGVSTDHSHGINFTSQASGDANEARPYSATVLTCIKLFD
jgi:microcystin-dependent protein